MYGIHLGDIYQTVKIMYIAVQMHKLDDIIELYPKNSIYVRTVNADRDEDFYKKFKAIHDVVYRKPYDLHIMDWIAALENIKTPLSINSMWKNTDHFWCSAFVGFVYYKLGWILEVNWTIISPREFSGESSESEGRIEFVCEISDEDLLL